MIFYINKYPIKYPMQINLPSKSKSELQSANVPVAVLPIGTVFVIDGINSSMLDLTTIQETLSYQVSVSCDLLQFAFTGCSQLPTTTT